MILQTFSFKLKAFISITSKKSQRYVDLFVHSPQLTLMFNIWLQILCNVRHKSPTQRYWTLDIFPALQPTSLLACFRIVARSSGRLWSSQSLCFIVHQSCTVHPRSHFTTLTSKTLLHFNYICAQLEYQNNKKMCHCPATYRLCI